MRRPFIYLKEYKDVCRHNGARSRQTAFNVHLCKISIMNYSRGKWRSTYLLFGLFCTQQCNICSLSRTGFKKKKGWIQCRIRHLNNNFSFSYTAVLSHWGMLVRVQPSCISGIIYCACNSALKSKWGPRVEYIQHAVIYSYENHYWFILLVSWRMLMERGRNGDGIWMWL